MTVLRKQLRDNNVKYLIAKNTLMKLAARHGFHGIHFADDWGTQSGLMISPALWMRRMSAP
mgnify:CR=1 FL=1